MWPECAVAMMHNLDQQGRFQGASSSPNGGWEPPGSFRERGKRTPSKNRGGGGRSHGNWKRYPPVKKMNYCGEAKTNGVCPQCTRIFDLRVRPPMILKCNHTICKECIEYVSVGSDIMCKQCNKSSGKRLQCSDISEVYPYNYYMVGQIYCSSPFSNNEMRPLSFKPAGTSVNFQSNTKGASRAPSVAGSVRGSIAPSIINICSSMNCTNESTLRCLDCNELYCDICSNKLHMSARGLMQHKIICLYISSCESHPGSIEEFHCCQCGGNHCSYCIISKHNGHEIKQLTKLEESDMPRFQMLLGKCEWILGKLNESYKKSNQHAMEHTVKVTKTSIDKYFLDMHSKLQSLELSLLKEVDTSVEGKHDSLANIRSELVENIRAVDELVKAGKTVLQKTRNSRHSVDSIMMRMENALKISCSLMDDDHSSDEHLLEFCKKVAESIPKTIDVKYTAGVVKLSHENEIPDDITMDVQLISDTSSATLSSGGRSKADVIIVDDAMDTEDRKQDVQKWIQNQQRSETMSICSSRRTWNDTFSRFSFKPNHRENVIITHLNSPSSIFVHLLRQEKQIDTLHRDIHESVKRLEVGMVSEPEIGKMYLARGVDKAKPIWCRVRLVDMSPPVPDPDKIICKLYFIDYGSSAQAPLSDLRTITQEFAIIPSMAYECKIYGIYPMGLDWDLRVSRFIAEILLESDVLIVVIEEKHGILGVDFISYGEDEYSLRDSLLFMGLGKTFDSEDVAPIKFVKQKKSMIFFDGINSIKKHRHLDVRITHIVSPHSLYVMKTQYEENFQELHKEMHNFYTNHRKGHVYVPTVGLCVAVKIKLSDKRESWYRGVVRETQKGRGLVEVFLVDIGSTLTISWKNLRKLHDNFFSLEKLAIHVKLSGVAPINDSTGWTDEANNFFTKYLDEKLELNMIVYEIGNPLEILLFEKLPPIELCLNAVMINKRLARSTGIQSLRVEWHQQNAGDNATEEFTTRGLLKTSQGKDFENEDSDSEEEDLQDYQMLPVTVLNIKSPACVYVHFIENRGIMRELETLHVGLQRYYNANPLITKTQWEIDDLAIALDVTTQQYHRVLIEKKLSHDRYLVFSRDHACNFEVHVDKLGSIDEQFRTSAPCAYRCHMYGVKPIGPNWTLTAQDFLVELLLNKSNVFVIKAGSLDMNTLSTPVVFTTKVMKPLSALEPAVLKLQNINKLLTKNGLGILLRDWNLEKIRIENPKVDDSTTPKKCKEWLPAEEITVQRFTAIATYVDIHAHVFFHTLDKLQEAANLEEEITRQLTCSIPSLLEVYKINDKVSVRYKNTDKWYRGLIKGFNAEEHELQVLMIDYGNTEDVPYMDVRKIAFFEHLPILARKIQLHNVFPKSGKYNTSEVDVLHKLVVDKEINITIINPEETPKTAIVMQGAIDVSRYMIDEFANCIDKLPGSSNTPSVIEVPEVLVVPSDSDDDPDVVIEDSAEVMDYKVIELHESQEIVVHIINVISHSEIIVELSEFLPDRERFDVMSADLQPYGESQPLLKNFEKGSPCIAKYDKDERWYRGKIYDSNPTLNNALILFVDFGNVEEVNRRDIRQINKDWLEVPLTQYLVTLNNFDVIKPEDLEAVQEHLGKYYDTVKRAKVVKIKPLTVDLYDMVSDELSYSDLIGAGILNINWCDAIL